MTEAVITEAVTGHEHKRTELRAKGGAYWIVSTVKRRAQGDFVVGIVKERRGRDGLQAREHVRIDVRTAGTWQRALALHEAAIEVLMREGMLKVELWKCAEHAHEKGI